MAWTERYVSVAGGGAHNGTSEANAWTLAEAIAAPYAVGQRINVKAGTYANTTTTITFAVAGTATQPIWWRGYNTTIGDLDSAHSLALPAITFTTGVFDCTGSYHLFSSLDISGAQTTAGQVRLRTGTNNVVDRCRIECTSANANGRALDLASAGGTISRSWLKATSSADVIRNGATYQTILGNAIVNGKDGVANASANTYMVIALNTFIDQADNAIMSSTTVRLWSISNSIYSPAGDGHDFNTTIPLHVVVANCIMSECTGTGINNSTGADTANIVRLHNLFHSNGANEAGFGDYPSLAEQTDAGTPFTSSTDLTIVNGSNAIAKGLPILFENQTYTSYLDIGAVQRVEPAGGGRPEFRGGNL